MAKKTNKKHATHRRVKKILNKVGAVDNIKLKQGHGVLMKNRVMIFIKRLITILTNTYTIILDVSISTNER